MRDKRLAQEGPIGQEGTFEDRVRAVFREETDRQQAQERHDRRRRRQQWLRRLVFFPALAIGAGVFYAYMTAYVATPSWARVLLSAAALLGVLLNAVMAQELLRRPRTGAATVPPPTASDPSTARPHDGRSDSGRGTR